MKKNLSHFVTLLVVLLLVAAATGCTAKARKARHLNKANQFLVANDYDRAEIEFLNVLRSDPLNAEAIGKLGSIYFEEGRIQRAAPFLTKGSELATNDLNLRIKLGFIYSAVGKANEARAQANYVLDRNPMSEEAPLLLAEASLTHKDTEVARQRLQALAQKGDHAVLAVALGNLTMREHDLAEAAAIFKRALALDPKCAPVYSSLATLSWLQNDLPTAEANFKKAAELSPVRSPRQLQYARFKLQTGDLAGGKVILETLTKKAPDYVPALMGLAEVAAAQTNFSESASQVQKVLSRDPDNFEATLFDGRLKMAQNQKDQAVVQLERLAHIYPQMAQAHYYLGAAYFGQEDLTKAIDSLGRAVELDPNYTEAILMLSEAQIKSRNPNPAIVALERLTQKLPQLVQGKLLLADTYRQVGRPERAMAIYLPLEKEYPKNVQLPLLIGSAYLEQTNNAEARREFERLRVMLPNNLIALEQLVNLDLMEKSYSVAQQRVQKELEQKPNVVELRLLLAKIFTAAGNTNQAEAMLIKAQEISPDNLDANLLLAQLYYDSKQSQKSLTQLEAGIAKNSKCVPALMLAANIHSDNKDYKKAAALYEQVLQADPKFSPAMNNLAYLDSEFLGQLDRAYDLAKQARDLWPYDPSTADTLGWICYLRGSYPTALGLLQESAAKMPSQPEILFHLGMANYMLGNEEAARAALLRARQAGISYSGHEQGEACLKILDINPQTADASALTLLEKRVSEKSDDKVALGRLADIYLKEGSFEKAGTAYEKVLQASAKNLPALINLAKIYARKDVSKAYQLAKDAYKSAPNDPEVSHLYGRLAFQSGDYKIAVTLLQQTIKSQPVDALALFDFAQAAYSNGRVTEAKTAMQSALSLNLPASEAAEAKRMLDLLNLAADPAQAVAASARLAEILKAEPDYVPALVAQAEANERQANLAAAASTYEKVLDRYQDFSPVQRQLAILYSRDSAKTNRAYALAMKARETFPSDPALTKAVGLILLQQGDAARAVKNLNDATAMLSGDAEAFFYLGMAHYQLKNRTESKAALKQAIALKLSAPQATAAQQMLDKLK